MDSKSIFQGNDLTERRSNRRLSSILKAPRSPLRDLGVGNELHQESAIEKRKSRRVSFAETIRVFTPELQSAGANANSGGDGAGFLFNNENENMDSRCPITGMDRLLHGPLQAQAHQTEWDSTNCNKDQTIVTSKNDMDMTSNHTGAIDERLHDVKSRKIDASSLLASFNAPVKSSDFDFKILTSQKLFDYKPASAAQGKIKFDDFLARLENENTTKMEDVDRDNIFSKEKVSLVEARVPFFDALENTGNVTRVFKDQQDALELTKCHTANITTFLPTVNVQQTSLPSSNPFASHSSTEQEFCPWESSNDKPIQSIFIDQTVLCEDNMPSRATRKRGVLKDIGPLDRRNFSFTSSNEKTIIFTDENDMDLTKNNSVFFNSAKKSRKSIQVKHTTFDEDQTTVYPENDMDMTKSHTVAIDGPSICKIFIEDTSVEPAKREDFGLLPSNSECLENPQHGLAETRMPLRSLRDVGQNKLVIGSTDILSKGGNEKDQEFDFSVSKSNATLPPSKKTILFASEEKEKPNKENAGLFLTSLMRPISDAGQNLWEFKPYATKIKFDDFARFGNVNSASSRKQTDVENNISLLSKENLPSAVPFFDARENTGNITRVFRDQDDGLELTKSHTANITMFLPKEPKCGNDKENEPIKLEKSRLNAEHPSSEKTILFSCEQDDMEMTRSHTVAINSNAAAGASKTCVPKSQFMKLTRLSSGFNKTLFFSSDGEDMDLTQCHTVRIDQKHLVKDLTNEAQIGADQPRLLQENMEMTMSGHLDLETSALAGADDMDLTKNDSVFFTSTKKSRQSIQIKRTTFDEDHTTVCPDNDMDMTKSHTVAIDGPSICKMFIEDSRVEPAKREDFGLLPSNSECLENHQRGLAATRMPLKSLRDVGQNKLVIGSTDILSKDGYEKEHEFDFSKSNATLPPSKKTILFASEEKEKPKKENAGLFLTRSMCPISGAGQNLWEFKPSTSATKIKFDDFARFGNVYSASSKKQTESEEFVSTSKENLSSTVPFFDAREDTLNITRVFRDQDDGLELTKSHTANITMFLPKEPKCDNDKENEPVTLEKSRLNTGLPSSEKTILFSCEQDDMEMTRSHTVAINSDAAAGASKTYVPKSVFNDKKSQFMKLTRLSSGFNKTLFFSSDSEDMDLTKCHTVRIDQKPLVKDLTNETPKGADQTRLLQENMEMTMIGHEDLETSVLAGADDTTVDNKTMVFIKEQQDMDFTQSHTVAIHGDTLGPDSTSTERPILGNVSSQCVVESDFSRMKGLKNYKDTLPETQQRPFNEHVFPCDQETMEITKAHTAFLEVNPVEENYKNVDPINPKSEHIPGVNIVELPKLLPGSYTTGKRESKDDFSRSLTNKTLFSESLGEMELAQMDTTPICDLSESGKKFPFADIEKTCSVLGTEMTITKNTEFIGPEFKDHEPATARINVKSSSNLPLNSESQVSDKNYAIKDAAEALHAEYVTLHDNEMADANARSGSTAILPPIAKNTHDQKTVNSPVSDLEVPSERGENVDGRASKTRASQQSEICVAPEVVPKKHSLSRRVTFCFPENVRESVAMQNITLSFPNQEKTSAVPNEFDSGQFECGNIKDQVGEASVKRDKISIGGMLEDFQPLNNVTEKSEEMDNRPVDGTSSGTSKENNHGIIAAIMLKMRNLTEKENKPNNPPAPVSSPTKDLYTLPQTQDPVSEDCIPTQTLGNEQVTIEDTQSNEKITKGKDTGATKEISLQNRLSVHMLQPKLPSKRQSNTCNLQELAPVSVSKPLVHTSRKSIGLEALADGDGQWIDEEMLPACLDDNEGNSMLLYDVPEGAWEELCVKEGLQKNLNDCSLSKETMNSSKRARASEDAQIQNREKRARRNDTHDLQSSRVLDPDVCSGSEYSSHFTNKNMEQTCCSSSSQDSRGEGMSELSSQQCSQMDSLLPWDNACGHNLWQKFQDGTITVKEFFMLLRIHILIQKPRYSEVPVNLQRGNDVTLSAMDMMLDRFVYQPKLKVYEEACQILYQTTEDLKVYTDIQEKPLYEFSSVFWEAMKMCSENELICFGARLKNMKSIYSKKSKTLAHEEKICMYSKLLQEAEDQVEAVRTSIDETSKLLEEIDDCISSLEIETNKLEEVSKNKWANLPSVKEIQCELESLSSQEQIAIKETSHLEEQKEMALAQLGSLQEESQGFDKHLETTDFSEWDMVTWEDGKATFLFLYDSLELNIEFGDKVDGDTFNKQPCRRISELKFESRLNKESAPASSLLVHRLVLRFVEKGCLRETCRTQNDVPKLLFDLSLVVSRCKLLGEEIDYLMKWGGRYNILKTCVECDEVKLLFSSSAAFAKFELSVQVSEKYTTVPLSFTLLNLIGGIEHSRVAAVVSKVPVGLWLLKRAVQRIHKDLLV